MEIFALIQALILVVIVILEFLILCWNEKEFRDWFLFIFSLI